MAKNIGCNATSNPLPFPDRRRPGRPETMPESLIPLLRGVAATAAPDAASPNPSAPAWHEPGDLMAIRSVMFGAALSLPIWIAQNSEAECFAD